MFRDRIVLMSKSDMKESYGNNLDCTVNILHSSFMNAMYKIRAEEVPVYDRLTVTEIDK